MKLRIIYIGFFVLLFPGKVLRAQPSVAVIPQPNRISLTGGELTLRDHSLVFEPEALLFRDASELFREQLFVRTGFTWFKTGEAAGAILAFKQNTGLEQEEYILDMGPDAIVVEASARAGAHNAVMSLLQMMVLGKEGGVSRIPRGKIQDKPAFSWRGYMLDESRHFFGVEKVKQLLNWMAFYKLNRFHWHLTDEPAWRLEIRKYPLLSLVGGIGSFTDPAAGARYYTQQEIRDIVAYAAKRQIEIIPEIDMPGHATAANRAYPQFSGGGSRNHPDFTFHPAKKGTYTYLTHILKEVNVLFPSGWVHLGGDEVSFGSEAWNNDRLIDSLKAGRKLAGNKEVETYFMRRMADSLFRMNARIGVWDEMADSGLPKEKTLQFWWRHDKPQQLQLALKNGYATVICPRIPLYFDFVQAENHRYGRKWGKAFGTLEALYKYPVEDLQKSETYKGQIAGVQGNLWTETVNTTDRLDFLTFPRLAALAEVGWSESRTKNYDRFLEGLRKHLGLYKEENLYFYDPFDPAKEEAYFNKPPERYPDNPED